MDRLVCLLGVALCYEFWAFDFGEGVYAVPGHKTRNWTHFFVYC